jgi:argininosuccinate synthase
MPPVPTPADSARKAEKERRERLQTGCREICHSRRDKRILRAQFKIHGLWKCAPKHTYPISVSSERIFQALAIARYANEIGADAIAHGSTGAGNDQVRFDMTFLVMAPGKEIITLTRDLALTRKQES